MKISLSTESLRFREKEKIKDLYGISDRELKKYIEEALYSEAHTGTFVLRKLESRLDNVVRRLGFAPDLEQARRLIKQGYVFVDDRRMDDVSYHVAPRETIHLDQSAMANLHAKGFGDLTGWLTREEGVGKVTHLPHYNELRKDVKISRIIEYYSSV